MCEILVMLGNQSHPDKALDKAGCYKRGDAVVVMPDGHEWGRAERPPKFVVVKVPGVAVKDALDFVATSPILRRIHRLPEEIVLEAEIMGGTAKVKKKDLSKSKQVKALD